MDQPAVQPLILGLQLDGTAIGSYGATLQQGQLSGSALVNVTTVPATLQLFNAGTNAIVPDDTFAIQGNLTILRS